MSRVHGSIDTTKGLNTLFSTKIECAALRKFVEPISKQKMLRNENNAILSYWDM